MEYNIPLQSADTIDRLERMSRMNRMVDMNTGKIDDFDVQNASFLDIFKGMVQNVVETNEQVDRDALDLVLGNIDDLATVQDHITKAEIAVDLLVSVKNEVLSAYNSIINMQI